MTEIQILESQKDVSSLEGTTLKKQKKHVHMDCSYDLAEVEIEPGAAEWQSSNLLFELHGLILSSNTKKWSIIQVMAWITV